MTTEHEAAESRRAVQAAAQRWCAGTMSADADALHRVLAPDYTYTHASNAKVDSRDEWLESFRTGGRRYQVYALMELGFRTYPGVVVMNGRAHQEMNPRGEPTELNTRFLSVWAALDGEWKCSAWQATRIVEPQ
jgi:ketosteroid isomerase-like protein